MTTATNRELIKRIWSLSWPTVLFNGLEASLGLVDLLMVRSLGVEATAAVGISRQVTFLVGSIVAALSAGIVTVVSQAAGGERWSDVHRVSWQSLYLLLTVGVPIGLIGTLLSRALLVALGADRATIFHAAPYLQISFMGIVFMWGIVLGAAFFRSLNDPVTPLQIAVGAALVNVPLNYVLIHGPGPMPALGVAGAALGSVTVQAIAATIYFWLLMGRRRVSFPTEQTANTITLQRHSERRFDWPLITKMLRIGTPMALAGLVRNGSRLVFLSIVGAGTMGITLHAAVGTGLQVRLIGVLPALAFQIATGTLVGQALGRGDYDEARRIGRRSVELLAVLMIGAVVLLMMFAGPLARLLIEDPATAELGATVVRWFAIAQFFSSLNITLQGALLGAGDTMPNLRYTFLTQWIIMLPLAWTTSHVAGWELYGPMIAWSVAPAILLIFISRRFFGRSQKTDLPT